MPAAISSGVAGRPAGASAANWSSASPMTAVPSVRVGPGLTALTRTPAGPGVVAQDVAWAAERLRGRGGGVEGGGGVDGVGGREPRRAAGRADGLDDGLALLLVPPADRHDGAGLGQGQGRGLADAAGGAGDEGGLPGEVLHGDTPLFDTETSRLVMRPSTETAGLVFPRRGLDSRHGADTGRGGPTTGAERRQ